MKKLLTGLTLLAAAIPTVNAEEVDSGFYIFPSIGYFFLDSDRDADDAPAVTFAAGYQFNNRFATEAAYGIFSSESEITGKDIDGSYYHIDGLYHLSDSNTLTPFIVAGIGNMDLDTEGSENDDETSYNAGLGVKHDLTNQLSIRTEARMFYGNDSNNKDTLLNVGLVYLFGGSSSSNNGEVTSKYDSDGDGVMDSDDQCPNTATGASIDSKGCVAEVATPASVVAPAAVVAPIDSDADGIVDSADKCPETPAEAKVDENGCQLTIAEPVSQTLHVQFANNSDAVPESAKNEIKSLSVFMTSYPSTKVTIEGHSDSSGNANYNQDLSERRAKAIAKSLVEEFGIEGTRVDAKGYGEENPIADNNTAEGRKENRRVVAVIENATK